MRIGILPLRLMIVAGVVFTTLAALAGYSLWQARLPEAPRAVPLQFVDITRASGIAFKHNSGAFGLKLMPETMGSGAAFIDVDGDGDQDIFFVNSRDWTPAEIDAYKKGFGKPKIMHYRYHTDVSTPRPRRRTTGALYLNDGQGHFRDITRGSGLDTEIYGMGAAVGDYDNDGRPDLFVSGVGRNFLFHNESTPARVLFREVAQPGGVRGSGWSTSATWVDYDKDGRLDLFVCRYVLWRPARDYGQSLNGIYKTYSGVTVYGGQTSLLYRNAGGGKFIDVAQKAGIARSIGRRAAPKTRWGTRTRDDAPSGETLNGKALGVAVCDHNNDGWPDLFVANDTEPNFLFENQRDGTFREIGAVAGLAFGADGSARAGMGTDAGDIDHSGRDSILVGNFYREKMGLYLNQGNGLFNDIASRSEVGSLSGQYLTFGCAFADVDNDGWPDILAANGHVADDIAMPTGDYTTRSGATYRQRPLLFRNRGRNQFEEIGLRSGAAFKKPIVARGLAYADIDLDGDVDVLFTINNGAPLLLRNDGGNARRSVRVVLHGAQSNRSALGAVVEAQLGSEIVRRTVRGGSSYCSQSELPLTLGLGRSSRIDTLAVRWPSGAITRLKDVPSGTILTVDEARGLVSQKFVKMDDGNTDKQLKGDRE